MLIVVAAAIFDGAARVLIQQRPHQKAHGGTWEFPGGKVEANESPASALIRELNEELGIRVQPSALEPLGFAHDAASEGGMLFLLYAIRGWTGTPEPLEAPALYWVTAEELDDIPMPPVDLAVVGSVRRAL